jgi:hypothetical protein
MKKDVFSKSSFPHVFSGGSTGLTTSGTRMDPRLKHSGVTDLGIRIFISAAIFKGFHEGLKT